MPMIYWTKALETGHEQIDSDHRVLVELLNRVQEASRAAGKDEVMAILGELGCYTEYHFAREEALMTECSYAFADSHRAEHRQLFLDFKNHVEDFAAGRIVASSLALHMQRWLIHHIVKADRHLGETIAGPATTRIAA